MTTGRMKAVRFHEFGGPEVLRLEEVPLPTPGPGELLVRVHATFVAPGRDVATRNGRHPIFPKLVTLPHILGGEFTGVVAAVGSGVPEDRIGDRVAGAAPIPCQTCEACRDGRPWDCTRVRAIGIHRAGSYAEFCVVPASNLQLLPESVSFVLGAVLAANGPLAYEQLQIANVGPDDVVLVPGASGSVGTLLVALACRAGATVVALARARRADEQLRAVGADAVLDPTRHDLADRLFEISRRGVDVVIDNVASADLWTSYWPAVARRGRIVFAGRASGERSPLPLDVVDFYNRRATITGLTIGDPRTVAGFWDQMRAEALELPESMVKTFRLADVATAHAAIEDGEKVGHFVLTLD
jgi:NADPH:quinone reductase-like Zn-dependent oxidoreductase